MQNSGTFFTVGKMVTATALFCAVAPMPLDYYMPLRIMVFIAALACTVHEWDDDFNFWIMAFLVCGILFNPLFPIYFYEKPYWIPIDILAGLLFLFSGIKDLKLKKRKKKL